jgi:small subunit ribosomal protein S2
MSQAKTTVQIPDLETFLKAGAHFGHKASTWNPRMEEFIYDERNGVHIIDLIKSMQCLKDALIKIEEVAETGHILLVGTKGQAVSVVERVANESGALYINTRWPGGLFTNFDVVKKGIERLINLEEILASGAQGFVKKEQLLMEREVDRLNRLYSGIKLMDKLPKLVIVIDSKLEKIAIREAKKVKVPIVALLDTNCDPTMVEYPIPANDDSIKSITLFLEIFGEAIKKGKKSQGLVELRKNYYAQLKSRRAEYDNKIAREEAIKTEEQQRIKRLKVGIPVMPEVKEEKKVVKASKELEQGIIDLAFGTKIENALKDSGIFTLEDLKSKSEKDLMDIKGLGEKTVKEIISKVK